MVSSGRGVPDGRPLPEPEVRERALSPHLRSCAHLLAPARLPVLARIPGGLGGRDSLQLGDTGAPPRAQLSFHPVKTTCRDRFTRNSAVLCAIEVQSGVPEHGTCSSCGMPPTDPRPGVGAPETPVPPPRCLGPRWTVLGR